MTAHFPEVERPPRNRRRLGDADMDWDNDLQDALLATLTTGKAISLKLSHFHSSPAKGRIWNMEPRGHLRVHHRVMPDRETVAAWVAKPAEGLPNPR